MFRARAGACAGNVDAATPALGARYDSTSKTREVDAAAKKSGPNRFFAHMGEDDVKVEKNVSTIRIPPFPRSSFPPRIALYPQNMFEEKNRKQI